MRAHQIRGPRSLGILQLTPRRTWLSRRLGRTGRALPGFVLVAALPVLPLAHAGILPQVYATRKWRDNWTMPLLSASDQNRLRDEFTHLSRRVHVLFFTQSIGCETCLQTRQILDELPTLSDRIVIDEINLVLEADRAKQYGVDRAPAMALAYEDDELGVGDAAEGHEPVLVDSRIRFLGAPAGYEFVALVQAILLVGGGESQLSESSRRRLDAVDRPVTMQVFTTPT